MTWIGKKFFNLKTKELGKCIDSQNGRYMILVIEFPSGEELAYLDNIGYAEREMNIVSNEQIKHLFWENENRWCPLADLSNVKDEKQLWIEWGVLDPLTRESGGYKEVLKN